MNASRLFNASCLAIAATALAFSVRADIIPALKLDLGLTDTEIGQIAGAGLWGFAITIVLGGIFLDNLGMGRLMAFAFFGHAGGIALTLLAGEFWLLFFGTLFMGLAQGTIEAVTNPLAVTLYPHDRTRRLNILHAWWPVGLIVGGLLAYGLTRLLSLDGLAVSADLVSLGWKIKMGLVLIPVLLYGVLCLGQSFPKTERMASGIGYRQMFGVMRRPLFLLLLFLMLLTTATELGPDNWIGNLLQNLVGIQGILVLVYTAGLMFVLRQFLSGVLVRLLTPVGLLTVSSILAALGLFWLSYATTSSVVFAAATVFGVGKTFFWPCMLGITSERFPEGGAFALGLMGGAGIISAGFLMVPAMGMLQDHYAVTRIREVSPPTVHKVLKDGNQGIDEKKVLGLSDPAERQVIHDAKTYSAVMTYRWISLVPAVLALVFAGLYLYFKSIGGYRAVEIRKNEENYLAEQEGSAS
jgi:MFS family permease